MVSQPRLAVLRRRIYQQSKSLYSFEGVKDCKSSHIEESFGFFNNHNLIVRSFGDYNGEDPPVPIPNTEVKLSSAHDTWLETARENRSSPNFYSSIAQSVEHAAVNRRVVGSSPTWGAKCF
jgi:hypothetical protein